MVPLLMHSPDVPASVRAELRAAHAATREHRDEHLARAARLLHRSVPLDCTDALELVGLPIGLPGSESLSPRPEPSAPRPARIAIDPASAE
jgi:hypothetical protein